MSIVTVFVSTSAENVGAERRFDKGITIEQLKVRPISASSVHLLFRSFESHGLTFLASKDQA